MWYPPDVAFDAYPLHVHAVHSGRPKTSLSEMEAAIHVQIYQLAIFFDVQAAVGGVPNRTLCIQEWLSQKDIKYVGSQKSQTSTIK
jgi:hypothetical protein